MKKGFGPDETPTPCEHDRSRPMASRPNQRQGASGEISRKPCRRGHKLELRLDTGQSNGRTFFGAMGWLASSRPEKLKLSPFDLFLFYMYSYS